MSTVDKKERTIPKVTVGIPVYRVEKYIERCARSLFEQTLNNIEYIFVDDKTPDNSMEILESVINDYPARIEQIKIIRHTDNRGSATSRNTVLENATGEYIIFCDSDDWVEKDMYEKLYEKAKLENADIVCSSICAVYAGNKEYRKFVQYQSKEHFIYDVLVGLEDGEVLTRLVRRSLYLDNNISFPDGFDMMEDYTVIIRLAFFAQKIVYVSESYYYLNRLTSDNISTVNNYRTEKWRRDVVHNIDLVANFLAVNTGNKYDKAIREAKLQYKVLINSFYEGKDRSFIKMIWPDIKPNPFRISSWKMERKVYIWLHYLTVREIIKPSILLFLKRVFKYMRN